MADLPAILNSPFDVGLADQLAPVSLGLRRPLAWW
ncbi:hypothetical protein SALB_01518 [Streptomyces noursei]|uniref:Uncharacterized protein n=1 Tax=Streptomyces noursei TaxID=1971 RepID=A0A401QU02_STRNR|nr:hypothetical protein SALB_01518 [Streptomyces noursei]